MSWCHVMDGLVEDCSQIGFVPQLFVVDALLLSSLFVVCNARNNMPDSSYGLCDTDSLEGEPDVVCNGKPGIICGVSVDSMQMHRQCRGTAKTRARAQARLNNAKRKHLHCMKESTGQRQLCLDIQRVRDHHCYAMKRRMAKSGESPVLCFNGLEDNREVPV